MSDEMDFEAEDRKRDRKLRRKLLATLNVARGGPLGGLKGSVLMGLVDSNMPSALQFIGDDHCIALLRDLEGKGLVQKVDQRKRQGQRFCLENLFYAITPKGTSLVEETLPRDPDIEDSRI